MTVHNHLHSLYADPIFYILVFFLIASVAVTWIASVKKYGRVHISSMVFMASLPLILGFGFLITTFQFLGKFYVNVDTNKPPMNVSAQENKTLAKKFNMTPTDDVQPLYAYTPSNIDAARSALRTNDARNGVVILKNGHNQKVHCVYIGHATQTKRVNFRSAIDQVTISHALCSPSKLGTPRLIDASNK